MTTLAAPLDDCPPGRSAAEAEIVPAHLAQGRMQRRLMLALSLLAVAMLAAVAVAHRELIAPRPDLVTYAFRV